MQFIQIVLGWHDINDTLYFLSCLPVCVEIADKVCCQTCMLIGSCSMCQIYSTDISLLIF